MELTYNPIFQQLASSEQPSHEVSESNDQTFNTSVNSLDDLQRNGAENMQNNLLDLEGDLEDEDEITELDHPVGIIQRTFSHTSRRSSTTGESSNTAIQIANTIREESFNFLQRRKDEVDTRLLSIPMQEIQQVKLEFRDTLIGKRKFHIAWTLWVVGFSLIGGGIIAKLGNHSFVDSWFTAASAICNAGLNVISPEFHPKESLAVIAILMTLGCSSIMLIPTMVVRVLRLKKYRSQMKECLTAIQSSPSSWSFRQLEHQVDQQTASSSQSDLKNILIIVADYYKLYDALIAAIVIVFLYTFLWMFFGTLLLYFGLLLYPIEPILQARGVTVLENAIFFSISSFTNSGLCISPNGLFHVTDNDFVLFVSSVLILVGNTLMPVLLRYSISFLLWCIQRFILSSNTSSSSPPSFLPSSDTVFSPFSHPSPLPSSSSSPSLPSLHDHDTPFRYNTRVRFLGLDWHRISDALEYLLTNPRRICTHLFTHKDCIYLLQFAILCNAIEYFFFLITCLPRPAIEKYGSMGKLLKLGLFQTLNTRHSGFGVFDLRTFPQDMLFVMALSMFLSSVPYISLLGNTATEGPHSLVSPLIG
jgi:Trk-type K+ transport system membrane component